MNYRRAQDVITLILTTVLQPRCALCDQNHRLPDRLCPACKISVNNALSLHFAPHSNIHSMSRSHSNVFPREILGRGIPALNYVENIEGAKWTSFRLQLSGSDRRTCNTLEVPWDDRAYRIHSRSYLRGLPTTT